MHSGGRESLFLCQMLLWQRLLGFAGSSLALEMATCGPLTMVRTTNPNHMPGGFLLFYRKAPDCFFSFFSFLANVPIREIIAFWQSSSSINNHYHVSFQCILGQLVFVFALEGDIVPEQAASKDPLFITPNESIMSLLLNLMSYSTDYHSELIKLSYHNDLLMYFH